jgi:hypothetical protein
MNRIALFTVAAAALAAPAFAEPAAELSFVRDGVEYRATTIEQDGVRQITGYEVGSNRKFDLRVQNGYVTGEYDGDRVAYTAPVKAPRDKK